MWNGWSQQAYDVFKRTLSRRRFGLTIFSEEWIDSNVRGFSIRDETNGDCFDLVAIARRAGVRISIKEKPAGSFRFEAFFSKYHSVPMRKEAVICAKKIMAKTLYDVLAV